MNSVNNSNVSTNQLVENRIKTTTTRTNLEKSKDESNDFVPNATSTTFSGESSSTKLIDNVGDDVNDKDSKRIQDGVSGREEEQTPKNNLNTTELKDPTNSAFSNKPEMVNVSSTSEGVISIISTSDSVACSQITSNNNLSIESSKPPRSKN